MFLQLVGLRLLWVEMKQAAAAFDTPDGEPGGLRYIHLQGDGAVWRSLTDRTNAKRSAGLLAGGVFLSGVGGALPLLWA
ncbi:MAG: hypothetical protein AAFZ07_04685 [Actinomycetota bacterium]